MKKIVNFVSNILLFFLILLSIAPPLHCQYSPPKHKFGLVTLGTLPIGKLGDWYGLSQTYGASIKFISSSNLFVEIEYGYIKYADGSIEDRTFFWPVDKQHHLSSQAEAYLQMHQVLINFYFLRKEMSVIGHGMRPFLTLGSGFHAFNNHVSGLIYPGQGSRPLDESLLLPAVSDDQVALGINMGIGFIFPLFEKMDLQFQTRYHAVFGTIRPFEDWGLSEIFPLQLIDFGIMIQYSF